MIDYEKIIQNSVNVNKTKGEKKSSNLKKKKTTKGVGVYIAKKR